MIQSDFKAAPMDTSARVTTALMIVIAGSVPFLPGMPTYFILLLPVVILVTWLFSVSAYSIREDSLFVHRPLWKSEIVLPTGAVATEESEITSKLWRTAGNGGLFGYTGGFRNKKLGNFRAYATNWNRAVSISCNDQSASFTIVVTPENPQQFILCISGN